MEVTKHHLTVPAQSWSLEELRDFCKRNLQISPVNQQDYRQLILAIDEVASNIVEHGHAFFKRGSYWENMKYA